MSFWKKIVEGISPEVELNTSKITIKVVNTIGNDLQWLDNHSMDNKGDTKYFASTLFSDDWYIWHEFPAFVL